MRTRSVGWGLLAGALGGAIGTVVLNLFQQLSIESSRAVEHHPEKPNSVTAQQQDLLKTFEKAHTRTSQSFASAVGRPLTDEQGKAAAPAAEFGFGIVCAAVYGALAEYIPPITAGFGSLYGASLFVGAAEAVLPAIGFIPPPSDRTAVQHAGGLSGNIVYGVCTEAVRRALRGR